MSELLTLLDRAQNGDNDACQQVLTENVGLIWSIVKRYSGCGVDTDDLYQLGCIGFIKAVKGFDLTYGTQFSTYAVPKIAGEIRRFLRDDGSVKVGRSLREKGQTLFYTRERLRHTLGEGTAAVRIGAGDGNDCGGGRRRRVGQRAAGIPPAGDHRRPDAGIHLGDRQPGGGDGRENSAAGSHRQPGRSGKGSPYFCVFFRGMTQEQTARILKVSQVQVSRLERKGLAKLREILEA